MNNAVARAGGLLAVAVLPLVSGLGRGSLTDPAALAPSFQRAMLFCAALLIVAAAISFAYVPGRRALPAAEPTPGPPRRHFHCDVSGPPLHPRHAAARR